MRRPILDSGEAVKIVYLSKAHRTMTDEDLLKALNHHEYLMRKELQSKGYLIVGVTRLLHGQEGDAKLVMRWCVLGEKRTKAWRKAQKLLNAKVQTLPEFGVGEDVSKDQDRKPPLAVL